jgi:glycosyltransferase involved in cell wall biosynthesis
LKSLLEQKGHHVLFYTEDNQEIAQYNALQKMGFFPRTLFSLRTYRRLLQIATQEKPDVAHVHNVFPLLSPSVYLALHQAGIPLVQTVHNYRLMCINGLFLRNGYICERCKAGAFFSGVRFKCYRDSYLLSGLYAMTISRHRRWGTFAKIDRFIAPTSFAAEKLIESGVAEASKISVLGNFMPDPLPDDGPPDFGEPYIVYLGRLSHEKGVLTLLHAMQNFSGLRLKVAGVGPLATQIHAYLKEHGLHHVEMLGFVAGEEKYRLLRGALGCVVPSECYEGFPIVVNESTAVGTPLIAARLGSLATVVSEGQTGLLFNPGDSADLREKLECLVRSPALAVRMGQRARQWLESGYTAEAHYQALLQIYQQVMQ